MSHNATFWDDCYAEGNSGWDLGAIHPAPMQLLENGKLTPCNIVILGGGRRYEVVELARRGFHVTALAIAAEPVGHIRRQLRDCDTSSQVLQQSIFGYRPNKSVDWVYEQTCFCAIDLSLRKHYEQTVFDRLRPNGKLFLLLIQKKENQNIGPRFHCDVKGVKAMFPDSHWCWSADRAAAQFGRPSGRIFEMAYVLRRLAD